MRIEVGKEIAAERKDCDCQGYPGEAEIPELHYECHSSKIQRWKEEKAHEQQPKDETLYIGSKRFRIRPVNDRFGSVVKLLLVIQHTMGKWIRLNCKARRHAILVAIEHVWQSGPTAC